MASLVVASRLSASRRGSIGLVAVTGVASTETEAGWSVVTDAACVKVASESSRRSHWL